MRLKKWFCCISNQRDSTDTRENSALNHLGNDPSSNRTLIFAPGLGNGAIGTAAPRAVSPAFVGRNNAFSMPLSGNNKAGTVPRSSAVLSTDVSEPRCASSVSAPSQPDLQSESEILSSAPANSRLSYFSRSVTLSVGKSSRNGVVDDSAAIDQSTTQFNGAATSSVINQSNGDGNDRISVASRSRPASLIVRDSGLKSKTSNDLLTPEVLENPEALAALGFGYPPGYGPPYPPLPLEVVLSLACRHRCVISPHDLEVHEMCRSPSSNTSGFCSGSLTADGKDCPSAAESVSSSEADRTLIRQPEASAEFSSWSSCDFPVELKDVQKLFQLGDKVLRENGDDCSDFNCLRVMFSALRILYYGDLKTLIPVVRHTTNESIADFLLTRAVVGVTPEEMIAAVSEVSEERVMGRFLPTRSRLGNLAEIELDRFLAFWIARGAVPILSLNMHPNDASVVTGNLDACAWQYRVVYGVDQGRVNLMTPVCSVSVQNLWQCLETPRTQIVFPDGVFQDDSLDSWSKGRETGDLSNLLHLDDSLNVLGQVTYFLEIAMANSPERIAANPLLQEGGRGSSRPVPALPAKLNFITLPTRMQPGILLFARTDNQALCKLIQKF